MSDPPMSDQSVNDQSVNDDIVSDGGGRRRPPPRRAAALVVVALAALAALVCATAACRDARPQEAPAAAEAPPPLPPVDLAAFEPAVREQLAAARRAAEASSSGAGAADPAARAAAWGDLGRLYHAYGLLEPAIAAYRHAAAAATPDDARWTYLLGVARQEAGELEAAAESLAAAHDAEPDDFAAAVRLGQVLLDLGRLDEAEDAYRAALAADPRSAAARHGLGRTALLAGDLAAADEHLTAARRLAPDAAPVAHALAELHRRRGEPQRVAAVSGTAPLAFPDPQVEAMRRLATGAASQVMRGARALAAGAGGAAVDELRRAVAADPTDPEARLGLAHALLRSGEPSPAAAAEARRQIEAMVAAAPGEPRYRYQAGLLLGALGDWAGAAGELERALALDPANRDALFRLAGALAFAGDHAAAIDRYGQVIAAEGDPAVRAEAHYLRGESRLALGGAAAAAGADFERALALQPLHADARLQLARLLAAAGRPAEALALLDAGLALAPGDPRLAAARAQLAAASRR